MKKNSSSEACALRGKVGGQAVLEGIMMKAGDQCATACRRPDDLIAVDKCEFRSVRKKHKILNLPILRGVINFVETMRLSMRTLTVSAEVGGFDLEEEESRFEKWLKEKCGIKFFDVLMGFAAVLGVLLCLFLFMYLPNLCADGIAFLVGRDLGALEAVIEGVIKILIFISYIVLVSLMPDIRRTFEYHGAEHKTIACFEAGEELTASNAARHTRFHPRCGTSFMFVMILLGIFAGLFVRLVFPGLPRLLYILVRLLILPLVVGIGYEFIIFAGKHDILLTRILSAPGLWMQRLTTKEPDEKQLEVAIVAAKCALGEEYFPDFDPAPYLENAKKRLNQQEEAAEATDFTEASEEEDSDAPAAENAPSEPEEALPAEEDTQTAQES